MTLRRSEGDEGMNICYQDEHWYPACTPDKLSSGGAEYVTCIKCVERMMLITHHDLAMWTKRLAELQQTVPKEFEQVFKDNFNDILA